MLVEMKEELKRLSKDPEDLFHQKVKKRIGKRATHVLEDRLRQFVLLTPSLLNRIHQRWQAKDMDPAIQKLGGFVFAYLYHPKDFLAEEEHGLFGYLDDAYLIVNVYERIMHATREPWDEEDLTYMEILSKTKRYVEAVIPDEAKKIEQMVEGAVHEQAYEKFASAFQGAA